LLRALAGDPAAGLEWLERRRLPDISQPPAPRFVSDGVMVRAGGDRDAIDALPD
jgi:hypothetical protein